MRPPPALLAVALLVPLGLVVQARGQPRSGWLEVEHPGPNAVRVAEPLIEVRGRAGARGGRGQDLIIAIDVSDSTTRPSGLDLDSDGEGGRTDAATLQRLAADPSVSPLLVKRLRTLDLEDSILMAELLAAEVLIGRLDLRTFRVGIVAFSDHARVVAPLGSDRITLRRGLHALRREFPAYLRGTHFAAALRLSHLQLLPDGDSAANDRERSILLLSDGAPTLPISAGGPELATYSAAAQVTADGVRIYAFALGPAAEDGLPVYHEIAALSGGRVERLAQPADAIARLRRLDLADLASIQIVNATTGVPSRAPRTFPDGSFDAFVPLGEGMNRIVFEAAGSDGSRARVEREALYEVSLDADRDALQRRLDELRRRTREMELWAELERGRDEQIKELELSPEAP